MTRNWSLDLSMSEKTQLVRAKAKARGISESDAFRLCVLEYETGIPQNKVTVQTENAYNAYKLEAPRAGTTADYLHSEKIKKELRREHAEAQRVALRLERKAEESVYERMVAKHGVKKAENAFRSLEDFEKEQGFFGVKMPSMPSLGLGSIKKSAQATAVVLMVFVALIFYVVFVKGRGAQGVTVVGK